MKRLMKVADPSVIVLDEASMTSTPDIEALRLGRVLGKLKGGRLLDILVGFLWLGFLVGHGLFFRRLSRFREVDVAL